MGTRSITKVYNKNGDVLVCLYRQFDGYPSGHGQDLLDFVKERTIVNGYNLQQTSQSFANGMGCLAAQIVAYFKEGIGHFYLYPANTKMDDVWAEYEYEVRPNELIESEAVVCVRDDPNGTFLPVDIFMVQQEENEE